jgi:hypothetical protein
LRTDGRKLEISKNPIADLEHPFAIDKDERKRDVPQSAIGDGNIGNFQTERTGSVTISSTAMTSFTMNGSA